MDLWCKNVLPRLQVVFGSLPFRASADSFVLNLSGGEDGFNGCCRSRLPSDHGRVRHHRDPEGGASGWWHGRDGRNGRHGWYGWNDVSPHYLGPLLGALSMTMHWAAFITIGLGVLNRLGISNHLYSFLWHERERNVTQPPKVSHSKCQSISGGWNHFFMIAFSSYFLFLICVQIVKCSI